MAWVPAVIAGASAIAGWYQNKRKNDKERAQANSAANTPGWGYNPWIYSALGQNVPGAMDRNSPNYVGNSGFYKDLVKLVNGEDLSQYLLNNPRNQLNRGYNTNMQRVQALLGRQGGTTGLGTSYALANIAGRNNALASLYNQYGQWREQQRRTDLNWIMGLTSNAKEQASGRAMQALPYSPTSPGLAGGFANLAQSGLAAYGALGGNSGGASLSAITTPANTSSGYTYPSTGGYGMPSTGTYNQWYSWK